MKALGSPEKEKASTNPVLGRGQRKNKILGEIIMSLVAFARPRRANGGGSGSATPASSTAYNSEATSDA